MKLLVTGAAGFIGSNFVRYWVNKYPEDKVVALDLLTYAGCIESLNDIESKISFVQADIGDGPKMLEIFEQYEIDTVVNFAAESHNSLAIIDPTRFFQTNVMGTQALLEAARRVKLNRFHHVSTCEVYGDLDLNDPGAFSETSPYKPKTPYNASKAGGDHAVRAYFETYDLPITITNCSNNYGPYQFPEKVIPLFTTRAINDEQLPLYKTTANKREWLHVDDHCRAIDLVLKNGEIGETYNVGSGIEKSIEEIANIVLEQLDKPETLKTIVPDRPSHDRRYLLDSSKLRNKLGWEPEIDFESGAKETIQWYVDNPQWWTPLLERAPVIEDNWEK